VQISHNAHPFVILVAEAVSAAINLFTEYEWPTEEDRQKAFEASVEASVGVILSQYADSNLWVPSESSLKRQNRDVMIYNAFRGDNLHELAIRFNVHKHTVRRALKRQAELIKNGGQRHRLE
jgi:Mor family transcriptional regulator